LGYTDAELSVLVVDDDEMARLNGQYRRIPSTTDVLSFSMLEGELGDVCPELLGDVVLCAPVARRMALRGGFPLQEILDILLIHGILHLLGYDHVQSPEEARLMEARSLEMLALLGHSPESFHWYLRGEDAP